MLKETPGITTLIEKLIFSSTGVSHPKINVIFSTCYGMENM
jgi:hypothetical protein